jgi:hypothetical protein
MLVLLLASSTYDDARSRLEADRVALAKKLRASRSGSARKAVYAEARSVVLHAVVDDLTPAWLGTPWTFEGTTDRPGEGSIACGMFVGTILAHAGFRLDRIAMGRLASEHIALSLTEEKNLRRYSNQDVAKVEADIVAWGEGLYVVGLDQHAGLAHVDASGTARFIHSTVYPPSDVRSEPFQGDNPLADSKYRVFAKLLDDRMIHRWLTGQWFAATKPARG